MSVFLRFLWPTLLLVGLSTVFSMIIGIWMGIRSGWRRGSTFDRTSMIGSLVLYSMPEFWLGMLLLLLFSSTLEWFPVGGRISTNASDLSFGGLRARRREPPVPPRPDAHARLHRRVLPRDALLAARRLGRGLHHHRASQGRDRTARPEAPRRAQRAAAHRHAGGPVVRLRDRRRDHRRGRLLLSGARAAHLHLDPGQGLLGPARAVPVLHARRDRLQPDRRLHVRLPGSTGSRDLGSKQTLSVGVDAPNPSLPIARQECRHSYADSVIQGCPED